jgi:hypothetical protein
VDTRQRGADHDFASLELHGAAARRRTCGLADREAPGIPEPIVGRIQMLI